MLLKRFKTRSFLVLLLILIPIMYFLKPYRSPDIQCYHHKSNSLPSIFQLEPIKGKSIFFHETSCNSDKNGKIVITARQACAVESAAKLNPNFEVYLLYVSPGLIKNEGTESDRFLQALATYQNVRIRHLDIEEYLEGTPVENLWKKGTLEQSIYAVSHTSDVLRYLTLWRYGGIYLDLDVIVTKPLEDLPPNYVGAESDSLLNAAILNFSPTGIGHDLATECLLDLKYKFSTTVWVNNGPGVITRLAQNLCGIENVTGLYDKNCKGFRIYSPEMFYPIPWENYTMYLDEDRVEEVKEKTKNSYVLHMWNKMSGGRVNSVDEEVAYTVFAKEFCPKVFSECGEFF